MEQFDCIVIGAGPGGYPAALQAAALGKRVAVIEQGALGGTCLNRGCIPTKTLLHASEAYLSAQQASRFGVQCSAIAVDYPALWAHKDETVASLRSGIAQQFAKRKITHITGRATVQDAHCVSVALPDGTKAEYQGEYILIATGSAPAIPPIKGVQHSNVLTSDEVFNQNRLGAGGAQPFASVVIIGGGVIGMEMATIYSNLGCQVTVLEGLARILAPFDKEIAQNLKMILKKRGVQIIAPALVEEILPTQAGLTCIYQEKGVQKSVSAEGVLLSVGRVATTEGLFAPALAAQLSFARGYLDTNEQFQTALPSIYAIGDVRGKVQLAHVATAEGAAAIANMFGTAQAHQNLALIPSCVYTEPEIASVGISADEAKAAGIAVITGKYIMSVNGKSVLSLAERGFMKIVADATTRRVLGAQLMCSRATDMIGECTLAIANELTVEQMLRAVRPHPTFAEGIGEALEAMPSATNESKSHI